MGRDVYDGRWVQLEDLSFLSQCRVQRKLRPPDNPLVIMICSSFVVALVGSIFDCCKANLVSVARVNAVESIAHSWTSCECALMFSVPLFMFVLLFYPSILLNASSGSKTHGRGRFTFLIWNLLFGSVRPGVRPGVQWVVAWALLDESCMLLALLWLLAARRGHCETPGEEGRVLRPDRSSLATCRRW